MRQALIERADLQGDAFCLAYAQAADEWLTELFDQATEARCPGDRPGGGGRLRAG